MYIGPKLPRDILTDREEDTLEIDYIEDRAILEVVAQDEDDRMFGFDKSHIPTLEKIIQFLKEQK